MAMRKVVCGLLFLSLVNSQDSLLSPLTSGQGLVGIMDHAFQVLDKHPTDGVITLEEAERIFTAYDENHDGNVTKEEFERTALSNKHLDDMIFDFFDKNHTRVLKMYLLHKDFNETDTNHDGKVTHAEYHTYLFKMALQFFGLDGLLG